MGSNSDFSRRKGREVYEAPHFGSFVKAHVTGVHHEITDFGEGDESKLLRSFSDLDPEKAGDISHDLSHQTDQGSIEYGLVHQRCSRIETVKTGYPGLKVDESELDELENPGSLKERVLGYSESKNRRQAMIEEVPASDILNNPEIPDETAGAAKYSLTTDINEALEPGKEKTSEGRRFIDAEVYLVSDGDYLTWEDDMGLVGFLSHDEVDLVQFTRGLFPEEEGYEGTNRILDGVEEYRNK